MLELFAGAQGSAVGWTRAGAEVVATDRTPHPKHPAIAEFFVADSMEVLRDHAFLRTFDWVAGGPPCQAFTKAQRIQGREHPNLIDDMRAECKAAGVHYVIENVPSPISPLVDPIELCGCMFPGLMVYRERWFESDLPLEAPPHGDHAEKLTKMGRPPVPGQRMHVVGHFSGVQQARDAMGINWKMSRDDLRESIPPAYTEYLAHQMIRRLSSGA